MESEFALICSLAEAAVQEKCRGVLCGREERVRLLQRLGTRDALLFQYFGGTCSGVQRREATVYFPEVYQVPGLGSLLEECEFGVH